jgi:hypothetical protein
MDLKLMDLTLYLLLHMHALPAACFVACELLLAWVQHAEVISRIIKAWRLRTAARALAGLGR